MQLSSAEFVRNVLARAWSRICVHSAIRKHLFSACVSMDMSALLWMAYVMLTVSTNTHTIGCIAPSTTSHRRGTFGTLEARPDAVKRERSIDVNV